jgi:hypothetical protein
VYIIATCSASILRGTGTDTYGDPVDNGTVIASGVIASIRETSQVVMDSATQSPRVIRYVAATLPSGTDVIDTDMVRDDSHGVLYSVEAVTQNRQPGFTPDLELQLKRVS